MCKPRPSCILLKPYMVRKLSGHVSIVSGFQDGRSPACGVHGASCEIALNYGLL